MESAFIKSLTVVLCCGLISCATGGVKKMTYYHGDKIPDVYVKVLHSSPEEIEFGINVKFPMAHAYHLVLENEEPVAEGWFPTAIAGASYYTVKLKPKKGYRFESGKSYRLCIGAESPEYVFVHSSNYRCLVDFEFSLPTK